ncbi:hypothetical protein BDZ91DRAFT_748460 [Kalaharituber pfeilii]|nr:hypothetical protein BDZ91DRAFT_748460 [Kalaharituber pfeilii]
MDFGTNDNRIMRNNQRILYILQHLPFHIVAKIGVLGQQAIRKFLIELPRRAYKRVKAFAKEHPILFTVIVISIVLGISAGPILAGIGFTAGGVAAGSAAAAWHSAIAIVAKGSFFAFLQSVGATGVLFTAGTAFAAAVPGLAALWFGIQKDGWLRKLPSGILNWGRRLLGY